MSGKMIVFLGIVGFCGYSLTRTPPPAPPGSTAADSATYAAAGYGARFEYGVGLVGAKVVRNSVTDMINDTEQSLLDMKVALKKARGPDGARARTFAKKVEEMNAVARTDLEYGHPIKAVKGAMEAKSVLNAVRIQLRDS